MLSDYVRSKPQAYLSAGIKINRKENFLSLRLEVIAIKPHLPPWERKGGTLTCRLCGSGKEDIIHVICNCPNLKDIRCTLLRPFFRYYGIRSCRQAVKLCFNPIDVQLNCQLINIFETVTKRLKTLLLPETC